VYLYRAVDSAGDTIDFMLLPNRDLVAAKQFLRLALHRTGRVRPRVINVDGHLAYASAIAELKQSRELGRRCRCRPSPYMNNVLEQDHRFIKKRIAASLWFRSVSGALNTIVGYESMHMIRKGQIRWLEKGDVVGRVRFIHQVYGIAA
jgi:IS6 family transposase